MGAVLASKEGRLGGVIVDWLPLMAKTTEWASAPAPISDSRTLVTGLVLSAIGTSTA